MRSRGWRPAAALLATSLLTAALFGAQPAVAATSHWGVPVHGSSVHFDDIAAYSPTNRWAVGERTVSVSGGLAFRPFIDRWNGKRWRAVSAPPLPKGAADGRLKRVFVRSPKDVWVVGDAEYSQESDFLAHWNGRRWSEHVLPKYFTVAHLAVLSHRSIWVLGERWSHFKNVARYVHWNGRRWQGGALPAVPTFEVSTSVPGDWATAYDPKSLKPRLLHLSDGRWHTQRGPKVTLPKGTTQYWFSDLVESARGLWLTVGYSFRDGQGPGLTLYRRDAGAWKRVLHLNGESPRGGTISDGRDGLWIASSYASPALLHVVRGKVTRRVRPPLWHGVRMQISRISAGPGHASIFAVGDFITEQKDQQVDYGAVARFVP